MYTIDKIKKELKMLEGVLLCWTIKKREYQQLLEGVNLLNEFDKDTYQDEFNNGIGTHIDYKVSEYSSIVNTLRKRLESIEQTYLKTHKIIQTA